MKRIKMIIIESKNSLKCPFFYSLWVEMLKKWTFSKLDPGSGFNLGYLCNAPPPPLNFAEFGAPALNRIIYTPHDHNTGRVYYYTSPLCQINIPQCLNIDFYP